MDSEVFDEFYGATSQRLLQFAYAMCGDHGVAQDLIQETFIHAWQRWPRLADYDQPESWLRMVVTRLVTDRWRWLGVRRRNMAYVGEPVAVAARRRIVSSSMPHCEDCLCGSGRPWLCTTC